MMVIGYKIEKFKYDGETILLSALTSSSRRWPPREKLFFL